MRIRSPAGRGRRRGPAGLLLVVWLGGAPAIGQTGPAEDAVPPPVPLDALLKLPSAAAPTAEQPSRGGATRKEWEERFARANADLAAARERLATAQAQLGELAANTESWQVAAPGGAGPGSENGPLSYSLRQEIRRAREDIARAEQAWHELRIEANFAGVPPEWIGPAPEVSAPEPEAP
jgi:hypothetical protein